MLQNLPPVSTPPFERPTAPAAVMSRLAEGRLGYWRLEGVLGVGSTGVVFRARGPDGSIAAVKVFCPPPETIPLLRDRFVREAEILDALRIPGIVRLVGPMNVYKDLVYFPMELLEGSTLDAHLRTGTIKSVTRAIDLCIEILRPLDDAHRMGIVHRDLKPANIFVLSSPVPPGELSIRLLDFGIAKKGVPFGSAVKESSGGLSLGTPAFMAPEQIIGEEVGAQTDVYAVGSVLYELLTGTAPYQAATVLDLCMRKLQDDAPLLRTVRPSVPARLEDLVRRALSRGVDDRPHSAAAFMAELKAVRGTLTAVQLGAIPETTQPAFTLRAPVILDDADDDVETHETFDSLEAVDSEPVERAEVADLPPVPKRAASSMVWPVVLTALVTLLVCGLVGTAWLYWQAHR